MTPDDLIIPRKSSERPICRVKTEARVQNDTLLAIDTVPPKALPQWPYFDCPTYDGPTYDGPTYNDDSQTKCFSPRNPSRFLNKSAVNQLQTALTRMLKSLFALIINPANKNGYGAQGYPLFGARDHSPFNLH